jgi:hypothetical protein
MQRKLPLESWKASTQSRQFGVPSQNAPRQRPSDAVRMIYGPNPFSEAVRVAEYLQEHTNPTDTIAILGSEPEIYFYAHRHSATGYIIPMD